jgi:hypothetical protein
VGEWAGGWMDGWMDRWVNGRVYGWMGGWMGVSVVNLDLQVMSSREVIRGYCVPFGNT